MRYGLKETTIQQICDVLARHPQVDKAVLYGSRAMGRFKNGSDIDITLFGGEGLTLQVLYKIMDEIDDLLLPYTFDLSVYSKLGDDDLIDHIKRVGVTFFERAEVVPGTLAAL